MFGLFSKRPERLSLDVSAHPSAVAVMHMRINDSQMLDSTLRGRNQTGGAPYNGAFSSKLSIDMMWYDLIEEKFYRSQFDVDAKALSTFGGRGDHASLSVEVGPGAAVTISTPGPEALRLIGLNQMDDITPEMDVPVVFLEGCAPEVPADPSPNGILMRALSDQAGVNRAFEKRENWLAEHEPKTTCAEEGSS